MEERIIKRDTTLQIRLDPRIKLKFKVWCSLNETDMTAVLLNIIQDKIKQLPQNIQ